jgi:hypothetical protein
MPIAKGLMESRLPGPQNGITAIAPSQIPYLLSTTRLTQLWYLLTDPQNNHVHS